MNKFTLEKNWKRSLLACVVAVLVSMTITERAAATEKADTSDPKFVPLDAQKPPAPLTKSQLKT